MPAVRNAGAHVPALGGEACVVIASYAGEPTHPDWWLNLSAGASADVVR
jgi:hypothetical protein